MDNPRHERARMRHPRDHWAGFWENPSSIRGLPVSGHLRATVATRARWSEPPMSTVWVPSEAIESPSSTWSIRISGGSNGTIPTWLAGQVGCQPSLASSPASRNPASSRLAHHVVVGGGVHVADDQVGVVGLGLLEDRAVVGAPAGRVDRGDGVHAEQGQPAVLRLPAVELVRSRTGRSAARWRGSSCRRPCGPAPRPARAAARPGRRASSRSSRSGVISSSTRRSTSLSRTASTTSWASARPS